MFAWFQPSASGLVRRGRLFGTLLEWSPFVRLISCALTIRQIYARLKTETRRVGWKSVKTGQRLQFVDRCMGFKKGEHPEPVASIVVTDVIREPLNRITRDGCCREGFSELQPSDFISMFTKNMRCDPCQTVTVIRFKFIPGGRAQWTGVCRRCGCVEDDACDSFEHGSCWWTEDDLCSFCDDSLGLNHEGVLRPSFTPRNWEFV
jgi:hypothetical protein